MLVLTRKQNEVICIGNEIEVMVVEIRGDRVRLGFTAPAEVLVDRQEVREKRLREVEPLPGRIDTGPGIEVNE